MAHEFEPETVPIPAGEFWMGSPLSDKLRSHSEPEQFRLHLDAYRIGRYPVTVGQYRAFIEAGGYDNRSCWTQSGWEQRQKAGWTEPRHWDDSTWAGDDLLPVVGVSWYEAYAYTRWLSEATGRAYTLPTESQWEKAARGGLQLADGSRNPNPKRIWPWGDDEPTAELCNFNINTGQTSPVTSHAAQADLQPYGLYHMAGNVWEWCLSAWQNPFKHPEPNGVEDDAWRVLRGGSWNYYHRHVRCSNRPSHDPHLRFNNYCLRVCAASLPF
ncbi:MAG: formylglycine-generating enzyme family protein [Chloroflexi bacterium]|nr:formylglycine-generating enzyme family protein [Chloroflexota bacterium]